MSDTPEQLARREVYRLVCRERDDQAAAVIRSYGDQCRAEGYAQAVADVVEWLAQELQYDVLSGMAALRFREDA